MAARGAPLDPPKKRPNDEEHAIIAALLHPSGERQKMDGVRLTVPPGDDAAVLEDALTITTDALIEGVHFDARCPPSSVGFKSIAVSISDLAAMGATPSWATLTLAAPAGRFPWIRDFAVGLREACDTWSVTLVGGDTTGSPGPIMISVTLAGHCKAPPLTRTHAMPHDQI
jgi:thiamine-monophosphate kinase